MEENNKNKDYEFVLLERLEGKVDAIIEGQRVMESEHKEMKEKVEKIDLLVEDMDFVKSEVVEIRKRFKETDDSLVKKADEAITDDHERRLVKLESKVLVET